MLAHPGPQSFEDVADQRIAGTGEAVMHPFPVAFDLDQASPAQLGEMARNLRLVEPEGAMEIADADLLLGQQVQQAQSGGVGERFKELLGLNRIRFLHEQHIRSNAYVSQETYLSGRIYGRGGS